MQNESNRVMGMIWRHCSMEQRFELSRLIQEHQLAQVCRDIGLFDRQRILREQRATRTALRKLVRQVMGPKASRLLGR